MPEVKQPQREVTFKQKFIATAVVLILYIIMSNIPLYGISLNETTDTMYWLRVILASQRGTLTELGIGPIVTAGLVMQLLLGSKLINVDMSDPYDRSMFSGSQKVMGMFMTIFQAIMYIVGGQFGDLATIGIVNAVLIFLQLMFAGLVVILLDEVLQKGWGLGSGVSLFIATGVAGQIFWNCFSFISGTDNLPRGAVIAFFSVLFDNDPTTNISDIWNRGSQVGGSLIGLIITIVIFIIVVWFESTKVEIPLQYAGYRGFKGKYPMKLLYVSTIPIILLQALNANFLFIGQLIAGPASGLRGRGFDFWLNIIGVFQAPTDGGGAGQLRPVSGLLYLITPPLGLASLMADPLHAVLNLFINMLMCVGLGRVWVSVSGIAPKDIAGQILDSGMQVPGFRRSEKIIERILKRYIPTLVILNGIIIAVLSFGADSFGALTSGTGLLIAIGITHQYAETISKEVAAMQYPSMRGMLGLD